VGRLLVGFVNWMVMAVFYFFTNSMLLLLIIELGIVDEMRVFMDAPRGFFF
jgi:hypothetical protein